MRISIYSKGRQMSIDEMSCGYKRVTSHFGTRQQNETNEQNMIAYHGTDRTSANNIVGPPSNIDVTRGGGELGRGFYLGENIALAASLSKGKFGANGVVIKFDIDDSSYVRLNTKFLNRRQYVHRLWQSLIRRARAFQHLFNVDVICAPFATIDFSYQYKFESQDAQNTLNNNSTKQIL